jgi:hypothetical protein
MAKTGVCVQPLLYILTSLKRGERNSVCVCVCVCVCVRVCVCVCVCVCVYVVGECGYEVWRKWVACTAFAVRITIETLHFNPCFFFEGQP